MSVIANIEYTNYPFNNPEYLGWDNEGGYSAARFFPIYEILDEDWRIDISFTWVNDGEVEEVLENAKTNILSVTADLSLQGITITIDNEPTKGVATITGTYVDVFTQRIYDIRMLTDDIYPNFLNFDADIIAIGDDYFAPFRYTPDRRTHLDQMFTFEIECTDPFADGNREIYVRNQTVLNNWEANRRRLLQLRDNLKRGEELEAKLRESTATLEAARIENPEGFPEVIRLR